MKPLADAIGASVFFGLVVVMLGCVPLPTSSNDLQPFIAVAGNYGVEEAAATPTPAPVSDVCESCRGTGKADGRAICPACNGTGKTTKAKVTRVLMKARRTTTSCPPIIAAWTTAWAR